MAGTKKKVTKSKKVTKVMETKQVIVFKANKPLMEDQFKLLSDLVAHEHKKKGVKIILMPYSCDLVEQPEVKEVKEQPEVEEAIEVEVTEATDVVEETEVEEAGSDKDE